MERNKEFLATEPVGRLLFKLAVPTLIAQLVNMLYNIVDRIYIGHIPEVGSLALTGLGVCMPVIMIVSAFAALASVGGAPRASIFMGKGDTESAERCLGGCFTLQAVVSAVLTAMLLLFGRKFLLLFGASENTISYAWGYLRIYALGTVFVQITLGMNAFISAQGFTRTSMASVMIGAICNIALDPILIFGLDMGVRGAALATIISQAASCVWVLSFLLGKKTLLRLRPAFMRLTPKIIFPCVALGTAVFIMQSSESIVSICFNSSLQKYGGDIAVGAMTILTSVMQFAMLPLQGIAQGSQPICSYNYGARNVERVRQTVRLLLICSLTYSVTLWGAVELAPSLFAKLFTPDKELIDYAAKALRIYMSGMLLFGIQVACQMTFNSLGNAKSSIIVAVMRKFVLLIPLIYIMPAIMENKVKAVYMAEPIADFLAVAFTSILFYFQFKKSIREIS